MRTFAEFWPFYLQEHSRPLNQKLHFVGTSGGLIALWGALVQSRPVFILYGLAIAYGLAWIGHIFVQRNRPATFRYPFFSFIADFKLWFWFITGKLGRYNARKS